MSSGNKVLVGLLDSGVSVNQQRVRASRGFHWNETDQRVTKTDASPDQLGHGSVLGDIICRKVEFAQLLVAQVFHQHLNTTADQVAEALGWLTDMGAQLVNMSFGLRADHDTLRKTCQRAADKGVVLVVLPARGQAVFPAAYPGVIRATGDARCAIDEISWLNSRQADYGACVRWDETELAGASVACGFLSAHIAAFMQQGAGDLVQRLRQKASYIGTEKRQPQSD